MRVELKIAVAKSCTKQDTPYRQTGNTLVKYKCETCRHWSNGNCEKELAYPVIGFECFSRRRYG